MKLTRKYLEKILNKGKKASVSKDNIKKEVVDDTKEKISKKETKEVVDDTKEKISKKDDLKDTKKISKKETKEVVDDTKEKISKKDVEITSKEINAA